MKNDENMICRQMVVASVQSDKLDFGPDAYSKFIQSLNKAFEQVVEDMGIDVPFIALPDCVHLDVLTICGEERKDNSKSCNVVEVKW